MKIRGAKRALLLADVFNLLVAIYLIVIAIVSLVKLRWYHQLTIAVKTRHVITSATSYFAFFILIFAGLVLITIFVMDTIRLHPRTYVSPAGKLDSIDNHVAFTSSPSPDGQHQLIGAGHSNSSSSSNNNNSNISAESAHLADSTTSGAGQALNEQTSAKQRIDLAPLQPARFSPPAAAATNFGGHNRIIVKDSIAPHSSSSAICCSILLYLLASVSLIVVLVLWLLNTGELVRDSISTQLDAALSKYQFSNRSNHYSVAVDGMQDVNNCCGSLDYTDFPHQRVSGLSSGHYPGSCCGKNIFGVNARVLCTPEEIFRARQTTGCTTVLSNYYDLMSLLIVPVALVGLFVNITIIGLIVIARTDNTDLNRPLAARDKFELKSAAVA